MYMVRRVSREGGGFLTHIFAQYFYPTFSRKFLHNIAFLVVSETFYNIATVLTSSGGSMEFMLSSTQCRAAPPGRALLEHRNFVWSKRSLISSLTEGARAGPSVLSMSSPEAAFALCVCVFVKVWACSASMCLRVVVLVFERRVRGF